ncbi:hypothetical protein OROGR_012877 [Orobanche gracilis]
MGKKEGKKDSTAGAPASEEDHVDATSKGSGAPASGQDHHTRSSK